MKAITKIIIAVLIFCFGQLVVGQSLDEYLKKANDFNQAGDFKNAAQVMESAVEQFPNDAVAYSYLGLYRGMQAGATSNFLLAGKLIGVSFEMLDKAVSLDANNPVVRLNRGLMGVKVPSFLNKLDGGIEDLEFIVKMQQSTPEKVPVDLLARAQNFLGEGYFKRNETEDAVAAWEKVIALLPNTALAESAQQSIAKASLPKAAEVKPTEITPPVEIQSLEETVKQNPNDAALYLKLGQAYLDLGEYEKAIKASKKSIALDSTDVQAYLLLNTATTQIASVGYDSRIYDDTTFRTNQVFDLVKLAEKMVEVAPDNPEALLIRGRIGVMMPFFISKMDQAIQDLERVRASSTTDEIKAEAIFWLGYAYQKKATTAWIDVIKNYSETGAVELAFASMAPSVEHFNPDKYKKPFVAIDFTLGFRDELAPQTAVWIEDKSGNFVKTVYVSGFSGFAKEKQINLPRWSKSSDFKDVDGVTGASIDLGHHIYVWDLKDSTGKTVRAGEFVVKAEVSYWPSMEYQAVATPIRIGKKDTRVIVQEGNLIPYLEVQYFAKSR